MADLRITSMAHDLMAHAASRQTVVARNMANADTPGFRAMELPSFAETLERGSSLKATRAGHIGWDEGRPESEAREVRAEAAPNGNTVSLETEMMRSAEIRQQHDMGLSIYSTVSQIKSMALGRK